MNNNISQVKPEDLGKVAVLMGGWSAEREVSLKSGEAVFKALIEKKVDAHKIDVKRESIFDELKNGHFDRVFIILHGPGGEDGAMQSVLEIMEIPYTGSGVLASAIAMDKLRCKELLQGSGLPTPAYMKLEKTTDMNYVGATLGFPIMVKPTLEGSSIGMSKVNEEADLYKAWEIAADFGDTVLAEQWVHGKEYTVAILGEEALPVIRLETKREFYDYAAKYDDDDTQYHCPCGLNHEEESQLQRLAMAAFNAVGARGWGRVDIMCDEEGKPSVIEINTVPGMTSHSLVPMAAKANNISFEDLVLNILSQTVKEA
ncbi:MAG: D-alanine--D-alanine ligase [Gammaproteobacteria bacterium]|nr:D-alanine--D-alanine ligase [Gammaproteobacteria bacterium]MCW8987227.1 D-alanine--D-alanine ligase [Gammaproteobacteria bacterium]MCW9031066.1 D-alanine--D-alanine ligase [Gammaproteobacteria bacterium]